MTHSNELRRIVERDGFAVLPHCLDEDVVSRLCEQFGEGQDSQRNILSLPDVHALAKSRPVRELLQNVLGPNCFAVRGIFFNKTKETNWKVVWHQDVTIAVRERKDVKDFGPWSKKDGIPHVQPPEQVLSEMLAVRLHLDESGPDNGPLRVIRGSHLQGRLSAEQIIATEKENQVICTVPKGGALVMRPLLLHASSASTGAQPRRVIHFEFASRPLPDGLEWHAQY